MIHDLTCIEDCHFKRLLGVVGGDGGCASSANIEVEWIKIHDSLLALRTATLTSCWGWLEKLLDMLEVELFMIHSQMWLPKPPWQDIQLLKPLGQYKPSPKPDWQDVQLPKPSWITLCRLWGLPPLRHICLIISVFEILTGSRILVRLSIYYQRCININITKISALHHPTIWYFERMQNISLLINEK